MNEIDATTDDTTSEDMGGGTPGIEAGAFGAADEIALLRELVLKAHPDVVPELVHGNTVSDMLASVPDAQAAYARIAGAHTQPGSPHIPAGGTVRSQPVNAETLSSMAKIRSGLGSQQP